VVNRWGTGAVRWEAEPDGRPALRAVRGERLATVVPGHLGHDRQPETGPGEAAGLCASVETFKDGRQFPLGDAGTAIGDGEHTVADRDGHGSARGIELDGVVHQIRDGPLHGRGVHHRHRAVVVDGDGPCGATTRAPCHHPGKIPESGRCGRLVVVAVARHGYDLFDEGGEFAGVAVEIGDHRGPGRLVEVRVAAQHVKVGPQTRQRGAQLVAGVLDVTTTELADELVGGVLSAGPERLDAAAKHGVPAIVAPGCLDMVNFGEQASVPKQFAGRTFYIHNPQVTLMRTNADESAALGRLVASKLNASRSPVTVLIPRRGISVISAAGGPFHDAAADAALFSALETSLRPDIPRRSLDCDINDPAFARACVEALLENIRHHSAAS